MESVFGIARTFFQPISADDVLQPHSTGLGCDRMTFQVFEVLDWRILVNHNCLRIVLHGGRYGNHGQAARIPGNNLVARSQPNIRFARSHKLSNASVLRQRHDRHIETFGLIVAKIECRIESTVFRLRVPIKLQPDRSESTFTRCLRSTATSHDKCRERRQHCNESK